MNPGVVHVMVLAFLLGLSPALNAFADSVEDDHEYVEEMAEESLLDEIDTVNFSPDQIDTAKWDTAIQENQSILKANQKNSLEKYDRLIGKLSDIFDSKLSPLAPFEDDFMKQARDYLLIYIDPLGISAKEKVLKASLKRTQKLDKKQKEKIKVLFWARRPFDKESLATRSLLDGLTSNPSSPRREISSQRTFPKGLLKFGGMENPSFNYLRSYMPSTKGKQKLPGPNP